MTGGPPGGPADRVGEQGTPAPPPRASIVVPTYRRRESVRRLLLALRDQSAEPGAFEVIVVIDGSEDGTAEMVAGLAVPYELRAISKANGGRAAACNAGIAAARGDLLIILDDDMEPGREFVAAHLRAHAGEARLGVLGAVPIVVEETSSRVTRYVAAKFNAHLEQLRAGAAIRFRSFYSGNFSIARRLMVEVGGYDEAFRIYGNEDTELSLRLLRSGVELRYDPGAVARQYYEKDFPGLAADNRAKGRTAVLAMRLHPEEFGEFTLDGFREHSGKWRRSRKWMVARGAVLRAARVLPFLPAALVAAVRAVERIEPCRLDTLYGFVIDVFFWLGVRSALAEDLAPQRAG